MTDLIERFRAGAVAASLGALLMLAAPAAAAPDPSPVRLWSVSKVEQGAGEVPVTSGAQVGGALQKAVGLGRVVFNLPLHAPYWYWLPRDRAFGALSSSADGAHYSVMAQAPPPNPLRVGAAKGAVTHLDEYQAYEKRTSDASLRITLSDLLLQTIDDNNALAAWECPPEGNCEPVRTVVRFHARAYAESAGGDFFDAGGVAYLEGHQHSWRPGAATSADSPRPLWGEAQFDVDGDADDSDTGAAGVMALNQPRSLKVPLASVRRGELFAVHVTLEAEAVDDRGGESAAQAFIQDPQKREPLLLTARGLTRRGKPRFKEPHLTSLQPARCPAGRLRNAGVLQLSDARFAANESESAPMVLVTRTGGSHGSASVRVTARGGTARAGSDFRLTGTTVRFGDGDTSPRLVEIPIREDRQAEPAETFSVELAHARCGALGARHRAAVTIVDDDQSAPSPAPAPGFTIGGTVEGLSGTGLVLVDEGSELPVSANGRVAFSAPRSTGTSYDVEVRTQPHGPDQVCSVQHGTGMVSGADVADILVHCDTPPPPSGLDLTFGSGGRVSTPVGGAGHGEAVVIQPGGAIVTAGWRTTAVGNDFALTRHDAAGNLDQGFGAGGIATTDLGGDDDEAYDAALLADGGIVAVGRTDAAGFTKLDFGVARYRPDGTPNPGFGTGGIVSTDILGGGDQANAVAVQPDGKLVVAGFATRNGIDGDFALVRYKPDGTLDQSFGTNGVVTTDLGTRGDDARALLIQPDGRIVVAGTADEDIALARYTPAGQLDATFGHGGTTITDLGSEDVANGIALTPDGEIEVAGFTLGAHVDRDFLLARYRADGSLDTSFADQGAVKTDLGGGDDFAENLVVDPDGRTILVGRATSSTILDMAVVRYDADGTLDRSFDGDGILTADFHGRGEFGQDLALDSAGRIVAAGYTANGPDTEFALLRATA
jgi:uncharacterized delta-60 repeat protein